MLVGVDLVGVAVARGHVGRAQRAGGSADVGIGPGGVEHVHPHVAVLDGVPVLRAGGRGDSVERSRSLHGGGTSRALDRGGLGPDPEDIVVLAVVAVGREDRDALGGRQVARPEDVGDLRTGLSEVAVVDLGAVVVGGVPGQHQELGTRTADLRVQIGLALIEAGRVLPGVAHDVEGDLAGRSGGEEGGEGLDGPELGESRLGRREDGVTVGSARCEPLGRGRVLVLGGCADGVLGGGSGDRVLGGGPGE